MVHGDNKGLVLPPRVAKIQVVIMPVGITSTSSEQDKTDLIEECKELGKTLAANGVRVHCDMRDSVTPTWKFNHWEQKGVPLRLELDPQEVASGEVCAVRRDTGEKQYISRASVGQDISTLLDDIHAYLYAKAHRDLETHKVQVSSWNEFISNLDKGNLMLAPFCG